MTETWWSKGKRAVRKAMTKELRRHRMEEIGKDVALAGEKFNVATAEKFLTEADKENWEYYIKGFSYGYQQGFIEFMNEYRKRNNLSKKVSIKR